MGCAVPKQSIKVEEPRCGKCRVGKLILKLQSFQLHSIKMKLENLNHLKLYLEYGSERLNGLGLWRLEKQPNLFVFNIPIHKCCKQFTRILSVSIKNSQTQNSAFGFLSLNRFVESQKQQDQSVCFLNYNCSPAGKMRFGVRFQNIQNYQEFVFQVFSVFPRLIEENVFYQIRIVIGEETLIVNGELKNNLEIRWINPYVSARIPLELITEGKVQLYCINLKGEQKFIGEKEFSLALFNNPNLTSEKISLEDTLEKIVVNKDGKQDTKQVTGNFLIFIAKKQNSQIQEAMSPKRIKRPLRRMNFNSNEEDQMFKKNTFHSNKMIESQNRMDSEQSLNSKKRSHLNSMPPIQVYKTIRNMSLKKFKHKNY